MKAGAFPRPSWRTGAAAVSPHDGISRSEVRISPTRRGCAARTHTSAPCGRRDPASSPGPGGPDRWHECLRTHSRRILLLSIPARWTGAASWLEPGHDLYPGEPAVRAATSLTSNDTQDRPNVVCCARPSWPLPRESSARTAGPPGRPHAGHCTCGSPC